MRPITALFTFLMSLSALAQVPYTIGEPQISGDGCPQGSVSATLSPDGSAISLIFDNFNLSVPAGRYSANVPFGTRTCTFRIPVQVAPGINLETTTLDYRGFANIPALAKGSLVTSGPVIYRSRFRPSDNTLKTEFASMSDVFFIRQVIEQDFRLVCQQQRFIEFTTSIQVRSIYARGIVAINAPAQIVVDTADVGGTNEEGIELGIRAAPCR